MDITLIPIRMDAELTLARAGDTLVVCGTVLDFTDLEEGGQRGIDPADCPFVAGPVTRRDGRILLCVLRPYGAERRDAPPVPATLEITQDGPVTLPD